MIVTFLVKICLRIMVTHRNGIYKQKNGYLEVKVKSQQSFIYNKTDILAIF